MTTTTRRPRAVGAEGSAGLLSKARRVPAPSGGAAGSAAGRGAGWTRPQTAVIVAAGAGRRLGGGSGGAPPKPLRPVCGVPLIARVMASAARAGIRRFVVVVGHRADRMRAALPDLVPRGCALEIVYNPRFEEPNGGSLAVAARRVEEPFALLMADHLFSPDRLARALDRFVESGRSLLVVEGKERFRGDVEDATLVRVQGGLVAAIGKTLVAYDAVDTGMFVLRPGRVRAAFDAAGPRPSISKVMRGLARARGLDALELPGGAWQDVDTPADIRAAERMLYRSLTKSTDGPLAANVNRRISLFFSTRLWRYGVTPNAVTAGTLLLGIAAGAAFAHGGGAWWGLLGALLFQAQSVIDGVDGELARLLLRESRFGFWFDIVVDNLTHMAVFGGIALGQRADGVPGPWGAVGIAAAMGVAASFWAMAPLLSPDRKPETETAPRGPLKKLVDGLSRRDFTYLLFPIAAFRWLGGFLWVAAVGTWVYAATVVMLRARDRRRRRRAAR